MLAVDWGNWFAGFITGIAVFFAYGIYLLKKNGSGGS